MPEKFGIIIERERKRERGGEMERQTEGEMERQTDRQRQRQTESEKTLEELKLTLIVSSMIDLHVFYQFSCFIDACQSWSFSGRIGQRF